MRIWSLLRALACEGCTIDLLAFSQPGQNGHESTELRQVCNDIAVVPLALASLSNGTDYGKRLWALLYTLPYGVSQYSSTQMKAHLSAKLRQRSYDAIFCATPYPLVNFPPSLPVPLVLDDQNVEYILLQRYLSHERNIIKRAYAWLEYRRLRDWEHHACARADLVFVCSSHDQSILAGPSPESRVTVVPNIIDVEKYTPAAASNGATLVYLGGMDYYPNRDAIQFFVSDILPELRTLAPGVKLQVVFSPEHAPSKKFRKGFTRIPNVEFLAATDVHARVAEAAVFVVPIRIGSGTRFKILEAAAMAKPIVSTSVGSEGLNFTDGSEIVIADRPHSFAQAVADLINDPTRGRSLGLAARERVRQQYSFEFLRSTIRSILEDRSWRTPLGQENLQRHFQQTGTEVHMSRRST